MEFENLNISVQIWKPDDFVRTNSENIFYFLKTTNTITINNRMQNTQQKSKLFFQKTKSLQKTFFEKMIENLQKITFGTENNEL